MICARLPGSTSASDEQTARPEASPLDASAELHRGRQSGRESTLARLRERLRVDMERARVEVARPYQRGGPIELDRLEHDQVEHVQGEALEVLAVGLETRLRLLCRMVQRLSVHHQLAVLSWCDRI